MASPVFQARDIILECLLVRQGVVLTPMICRERANNIAQALQELLEPRGNVTSGEIETESTEVLQALANKLIR